jgi:hypothetical protein
MIRVDRIHRVIDGGMHDRETACRMDGRRLRSGRAHDRQKVPVPLHNRIYIRARGFRFLVIRRGMASGRAPALQRQDYSASAKRERQQTADDVHGMLRFG